MLLRDGHLQARTGPVLSRAAGATVRGVVRRDVGILAVLAIVLVGTLALIIEPFEPDTTSGDYVYYRSMAFNEFVVTRPDLDRLPPGHPHLVVYRFDTWGAWYDMRNGLAHQPPFAYRLLTPALARLVEPALGINAAFYFWTVAALMAAAFTMGLCLYRLTDALLPAAAAVVLLALDFATARLHLVRYMLTDPIALFLTVLAVYALIRRRPVMFYVTCLIGVVNRESMVPMVVCYPISEYLLDRQLRWQTWAAALGVAGAWFALRAFWPVPVNRYSVVDEFKPTLAQTKLVADTAVMVFGVLFIAAWRSVGRRTAASRFARSLVPFVIATFGAAWFIGSVDRILAQAIPFFVIIVLGCWPKQPFARLLVLVPVGAYLVSQLATTLGISNVLAPVSLLVIANEVALARAWRDESPVIE